MKIKKFKNIWTMGLILFGTILIVLYLIKLISPQFVINVAQSKSVVSFGNYVDSNLWAFYTFNTISSFIASYLYLGACCRKKVLKLFDLCILCIEIIILFIIQKFDMQHYIYANVVCMLLMPMLVCLKDKQSEIKYFYSTIITFSTHIIAQILSLKIRGIDTLISYPNTATFTILLIDVYIWLFLLYSYFNYKGDK